jgi:hypothetical protein
MMALLNYANSKKGLTSPGNTQFTGIYYAGALILPVIDMIQKLISEKRIDTTKVLIHFLLYPLTE